MLIFLAVLFGLPETLSPEKRMAGGMRHSLAAPSGWTGAWTAAGAHAIRAKYGFDCIRAGGVVRELPRALEEALWRIEQEALNNVKKHTGTNAVYIQLVKSEHSASLEITDRGSGFSVEKVRPEDDGNALDEGAGRNAWR